MRDINNKDHIKKEAVIIIINIRLFKYYLNKIFLILNVQL